MIPDEMRARHALMWLDAGCSRDDWVCIGMAAQAAGLGEDDFVEWSATGANYGGERSTRTVWRSIKPNGGIGEGTLFKLATAAGWRDPNKANGHAPPRPPAANGVTRPASKPTKPDRPRTDAQALWDGYAPAPESHPYIRAKGGVAEGLRVVPDDDPLTISGLRVAGWLVVPFHSIANGTLRTLQFVPRPDAQARKLNLHGAPFEDGAFITGSIAPDGRLYVCEGLGTAWACARADYHAAAVVTAGIGRFPKVAAALREKYPAAQVICVPDRGKEADAERVAREVGGGWVQMSDDAPPNYDACDYANEHGDEALADLLVRPRRPEMRFHLLSAHDLLTAPPMSWLVHGVLPREGLATLYGPPGSGKSFLVLDLCCAIAEGSAEWFGYRVSGAPVVYVVLEGRAGLGQRLQAWQAGHSGEVPERLRFVAQEVDLRTDTPDLAEAIVDAGGGGGLTVIDTLMRSMTAFDENSPEDMGALVAACGELQRLTGGAVMLVHHSGKDPAKGERGHSALRGALDCSLEVKREGGTRRWLVSKAKDGVDGSEAYFDLREVVFGMDDFGDELSSCTVVPASGGDAPPAAIRAPTTARQQVVYETVGSLLKASPDFGKGGAPVTRPCVRHENAVEAVAPKLTQYRPDQRRWAARQAIFAMQGKWYDTDGDWLWHR
ncbi:AAA family ATPase [Paraburkholderia sp. UCT31]|uniref:AAA family ATPase n=1 Tax=Paraburkholderia sp. UCT31 TaxID=2615209 RepID=UPI0016563695|nr:AAA family ATPase [Paraburkholderia sp. UCT31]MBC8739023.1 AAA family ATPase [Paraburkholderia sp. UCT31]